MTMLIVQDLQGDQQPLMVESLHITKQLNTLTQIDFSTVNTLENEAAFEMIQPRSIFIDPVDNEMYRISQKNGSEFGDYYQYQITALQIMTDLSDHYVHDVLYNTQSLDAVMRHITNGTKFSYSLHGSFNNHDFGAKDGNNFSPFGNGLAYDLFINSIVKDYNVEWSCTGNHIDLYNKIGSDNQFVCLDKDDVFQLQESADFTTLKTRIYGTGQADDSGNPKVSTTYTSPNAKQFGVIDAAPYSDDRATDINTLTNELKKQLQDYPLVQYQANINQFKHYANGLNNNYSIGNYGVVRSRWGIDITTRISKLDIYRDTPSNANVITFGNLQLNPTEVIVKLNQAHDKLVNNVNKVINDNQESVGSSEIIELDNGVINLSTSGGIAYVNFNFESIISNTTITTLSESYRPKQERTTSVVVLANKNYIVNFVIKTTGELYIADVTDLTGNTIDNIAQTADGSFSYLL